MNLDDLKDQFKEGFENARRQVEDNPVYITLKEKYDVLNPNAQKGILAVLGLLAVFIVMSPPLSFLSSSNEQTASFEENRNLVKELMKTDRQLKSGPKAPRPLSLDQLKKNAELIVSNAGLLPEQVSGTRSTVPRVSSLVSEGIKTNAVVVKVSKLNLNQVADIGFNLQNINDSVHMSGVDIKANIEDDHYYDVDYELTVFNVPVQEEPEEPVKKKRSRRGKKGK